MRVMRVPRFPAVMAWLLAALPVLADETFYGDARIVTVTNGEVIVLLAEDNIGNSNADHVFAFAPRTASYSGIDSTYSDARVVVTDDRDRLKLYDNSNNTLLADITVDNISLGTSPTLVGYVDGRGLGQDYIPDVCALNVSNAGAFTVIWQSGSDSSDCSAGGTGSTQCSYSCGSGDSSSSCDVSCGTGYHSCCYCSIFGKAKCRCRAS